MNDLREYAALCQEYAIKGREFTNQSAMDDMRDMLIANIKEEILDLIENGTIPQTAASFSELHDYVDANVLGDVEGLFDDFESEAWQVFCDEENMAQNTVDEWLKAGRPNE